MWGGGGGGGLLGRGTYRGGGGGAFGERNIQESQYATTARADNTVVKFANSLDSVILILLKSLIMSSFICIYTVCPLFFEFLARYIA